jgi:exo-beta-1,3-glucanase (GH17 family)
MIQKGSTQIKQTNKGNKMGTLTVGSEFVSQKSAHKGIIAEIVENVTGSMRVRFEDGRWTTVS